MMYWLLIISLMIVNIVNALTGLGGNPVPMPQAELVKLPYLQHVTQTSIVIMWETSEDVPSLLEYGNPAIPVHLREKVNIHAVPIRDLTPETAYAYRVSIDGAGERWSEWYTFHTAPLAERAFRVAVYGDTQSQSDVHTAVIQAMIEKDPDIVLHVGDLVSNGVIKRYWDEQFFGPAAPLLVDTPLFPVLGNHELNAPFYFDLFSLPNNEMWYAFTYGSARIIGLSTNTDVGPDSPQAAWLLDEFESEAYRSAQWHLVFFHQPPFFSEAGKVTGYLVPLFERYGVDIVLSGHRHHYERSEKDGVIYIVTGGGGGLLYQGVGESGLTPYSVSHAEAHHFCTLDITPDEIVITVWDVKGEMLDARRLEAE